MKRGTQCIMVSDKNMSDLAAGTVVFFVEHEDWFSLVAVDVQGAMGRRRYVSNDSFVALQNGVDAI